MSKAYIRNENVQRKATRIIRVVEKFPYKMKLNRQRLPILKKKQLGKIMTEVYKVLKERRKND